MKVPHLSPLRLGARHRLHESPGGVPRVVRPEDGAYHGDPHGTSPDHRRGVSGFNAPNANDRNRRLRGTAAKGLQPDRLASIRFGCSSKNWSHTEIVDTLGSSNGGLLVGLRRVSDDEIGSTRLLADSPGVSNGQIVDTEVNAVRTAGERDVQTVVDDEQRLVGAAHLADIPCKCEHRAVGEVLGAELDGRATAVQGLMHRERKIDARQVRVRDQVDGEAGGKRGQTRPASG